MYKKRATKSIPITDEMWSSINKEYRCLVDEFLREHRNKQTAKQYTSALKQFGWYIHSELDSKPYYKITKRDANNYINYLLDNGMSSSGIGLKKSAISSLNRYIELYIIDEDENYLSFRNFMTGLKPVDKTISYDRSNFVTMEEYESLINKLEINNRLLEASWLSLAFYTACRRSELKQFKTEILDYEIKDGNFIVSHDIRGKGRGETGKIFKVYIPISALKHAREYVRTRGFDNEYILSYENKNGFTGAVYDSWANEFCESFVSKELGRKITPHMFRHGYITHLKQNGVDINLISKYIAHHESVDTTQLYIHEDNSDKIKEIFKL